MVLVKEMDVAVDSLLAGEYWKLGGDELLEFGRALETMSRRVWAAQVRVVDELQRQGVAAARSVSSTAVLVREAFGISPAEAGSRLAAANATLPRQSTSGADLPTQRPVLGAAIAAGRVDAEHVRIALGTLRRLPDDLPPEVSAEAEQALVDNAVISDPQYFRRIARHLEGVLNPDGAPPDDDVRSKVEFSVGSRSATTGLTSINGWLDDLGVATIKAVIDPLAAPKPEVDGLKDRRPAATRRAHALIEALDHLLSHGDEILPDTRGERPHLTVTIDWDVVREQAQAATIDGHLLSAGDARRLLCDAQIIPAVLGGRSEVLDVGRSSRTVPTAIRRAISLRDNGCIFPGCDRPPSWCDGHHVEWWQRDLGNTSYDNCVLLCAFHHTEIHRSEWEIRFAPDGIPELVPPKWLDSKRSPRRNTLHHINPTMRM